MATQLGPDRSPCFSVRTSPAPETLGAALECNLRVRGAVLQLRFGEQVAGFPIEDIWSACCELLLDAELAEEGRLEHFVLDVEQIFDLSYSGDLLLCAFSSEHVFAVQRAAFAAALNDAVEQILASTTCPRLMKIAAAWGASAIRGLPYAHRFCASALT